MLSRNRRGNPRPHCAVGREQQGWSDSCGSAAGRPRSGKSMHIVSTLICQTIEASLKLEITTNGLCNLVLLTTWHCLVTLQFWHRRTLSQFCSPVNPTKARCGTSRSLASTSAWLRLRSGERVQIRNKLFLTASEDRFAMHLLAKNMLAFEQSSALR